MSNLFTQLHQLLVNQCTRRLRRHSFCFGERVALALRRRGAAAQDDERRVDLRDDGKGRRRQAVVPCASSTCRREPSARRSNRVLGSVASSVGRRTVAVTATRGRTVALPPVHRPGVDGISFTVHPRVTRTVRSATSGRIGAEEGEVVTHMGLKAQEAAQ